MFDVVVVVVEVVVVVVDVDVVETKPNVPTKIQRTRLVELER